MLICEHCGEIYDEDDVGSHYEEHGELRGDGCRCGGELVEAVRCPICDEYIPEGEHICSKCYDDGMTVENAVKYGAEYPIQIAINGLVAELLSAQTINEILIDYIYEYYKDGCKEVRDYFETDPYDYTDFLIMENS